MMANFKRGRGDNMGVAGNLNDNADITAPVYSFWPNDYGLYNMAGNVSEWVMDVYRPLSNDDRSDFRAFRGNVFQTKELNDDGTVADKDSLGHLKYRNVDVEKDNLAARRNYKRSDNINYLDGDVQSQSTLDWISPADAEFPESAGMYDAVRRGDEDVDMHSMIDDKARVYKGGSWKDRAYWMNPGTRRYLDERQSTNYIGFRCAMTRVGSPVGINSKQ
jgi:gliding motility-associated lipoprotein GldJ